VNQDNVVVIVAVVVVQRLVACHTLPYTNFCSRLGSGCGKRRLEERTTSRRRTIPLVGRTTFSVGRAIPLVGRIPRQDLGP